MRYINLHFAYLLAFAAHFDCLFGASKIFPFIYLFIFLDGMTGMQCTVMQGS